MPAIATTITADEYARLPDPGYPTELVKGEVVRMNQPVPRHGQICAKVSHMLLTYLDHHDSGHVLVNDAGIITERNPDTVRGGDVWYISYDKIPKGPLPSRYLDVPPDIMFEVRSPSDRWVRLMAKVVEYLQAGVPVVCVLDPDTQTARLHVADDPEIILQASDELTFPNQLPGFRVSVQALFE